MNDPVPASGSSSASGLDHLPALLARLTPDARRALLRADQRLRWQRNQPRPVEDYLRAAPGLADDAAALLDLIHGEFLLRRERGEGPTAAEYRARFPAAAEALDALLRAQDETQSRITPSPPTPAPGAAATRPDDPSPDQAAPPPASIPGYEILGELGRGGMGVVYKARQIKANRTVALKMLLGSRHASLEQRVRFQVEAEAVARLQHPHIVQLFEVGEHDGLPYFSLEFVAGGSLDKKLKGGPLPPREAAALIERLARAVHYAHLRGVVHRDLKPGNILLEIADCRLQIADLKSQSAICNLQSAIPKIADFGLAKQLDAGGPVSQSGAIVGTPSYMAPEQAAGRGREVGPAVDVYSLGAVLYECLTGRPPFRSDSVLDTLAQVLEREPDRPRRWNPETPRDLETICLKCLSKDPQRRYGSAEALADDLGRWLHGEPIQARPSGAWERGWKWARRRPAAAALLGVSLAAAAALLAGAWLYAHQEGLHSRELEGALADTERARRETSKAKTQVEKERDDAETARKETSEAKTQVEKQRDDIDRARKDAEGQRDEARRALYLAQFNGARRAWDENQVWLVHDLLAQLEPRPGDEHDHRGFEWHYLRRLCQSELRTWPSPGWPVRAVAFSPDGRLLATAGGEDVDPFSQPVPGLVILRDLATDKEVLRFKGHSAAVLTVALSRDGKRAASTGADGAVLVWETETGKVVASRKNLGDDKLPPRFLPVVNSVAFSPDGERLLLGGAGQPVRVWDLAADKDVHVLKAHGGTVYGVAYRPDGKQFATAGGDGKATVWDADAGTEVFTLTGHFELGGDPEDEPLADPFAPPDRGPPRKVKAVRKPAIVFAVAFSPDGKLLATSSADRTVKVWDAETGKEICACRGHTAEVFAVRFSPDGLRLASSSADTTVRVWSAVTGRELRTLKGHTGWVRGVAYSPDGKLLASAGDPSVKLWDAKADPAVLTLKGERILSLGFSPDGQRLAAGGLAGFLKVWHPATGQEVHGIQVVTMAFDTPGNFPVIGLAYSPDGRRLATGSDTGDVSVRDAATGVVEVRFRAHEGTLWDLSFSPDGKRLATCGGLLEHAARVWDADGGQPLFSLPAPKGGFQISSVAWSPDGKLLATASHDRTVRLWDAATGKPVRVLKGHAGAVRSVVFSPDGQRLASASYDGTLRVWNTASGASLMTLKWHTNQVTSVAWSQDGKRLASASEDRTVHVWDAATGQELLALRGHTARVSAVAFSRDGRYLASGDWDGVVKVWDSTLLTPEERRRREELLPELRLERDAAALVRSLAEKKPFKEDVLSGLRGDGKLAEPLRRRALELAEGYRQDPEPLNNACWEVVWKPGAGPEQYRQALRQIEAACRVAPGRGIYLDTLGAALYRVGRHEEAVKALLEADRLNTPAFEGPVPADWAFLAMAYHRLGQKAKADEAMTRLRKSRQSPRWAQDKESEALQREAEEVLKQPAEGRDEKER